MPEPELNDLHYRFLLAAYESVPVKTDYFYVSNVGHKVDILPHDAYQVAKQLTQAGLVELTNENPDRARFTGRGREETLKYRDRQAKAEAQKGRGWDVFLLIVGAIIGAILTLVTTYLTKLWG